jgi:outer membrane protein assembly factor BamB
VKLHLLRVAVVGLALTLVMSAVGVAGLTEPPAQSATASRAPAPEWPGWGGPRRNFTTDSTGLASSWPEGGPKQLWARDLGRGHSSILVDGDRLYTMYRPALAGGPGGFSEEEAVVALDRATGRTIWEHRYPASMEGLDVPLAGPHSTPLIVGDLLFATGTNRQVLALDKKTGKAVWSHDLIKEFDAPVRYLNMVQKPGYNCSPLVYKDMIIVIVGGPSQAVFAFRQRDGHVVWRGGDFPVAPASPSLITVQGQDQVVVFASTTVVGMDPNTGETLWSHPHPRRQSVNVSTPVWSDDNLLFVSSSQDDLGPAFLTAVHARTGEMAWQDRTFARSSFLYADGKLIILDEDGTLGLATVSPQGMNVLAKVALFTSQSWAVPTLVGTKLYVRDHARIIAMELGAS